jgi:hypothetical protein
MARRDVRAEAHVTDAAGLAVTWLEWSGLDTAPTVAMQLSGPSAARPSQADLGVAGVTADQLGVGAGRTGDLAALAGLQLDVVDDRADRHPPAAAALPGFTSTFSPAMIWSPTFRRCGAMM